MESKDYYDSNSTPTVLTTTTTTTYELLPHEHKRHQLQPTTTTTTQLPLHHKRLPDNISVSSYIASMASAHRYVRRAILLMILTTLITVLFINYNLITKYAGKFHMERSWYVFQNVESCSQPKPTLNAMNQLTEDAVKALTSLGVSPFACYGTLLGALKAFSVLAWDNNVDLCLVDEIPLDFESIEAQFSAFDIKITEYDSWNGEYRFTRHGIPGFITVFSECSVLSKFILRKDIQEISRSNDFLEFEPIDVNLLSADQNSSRKYESFRESKEKTKRNSNYIPEWVCPAGQIAASAQKMIDGREKPIAGKFVTPPFVKQPLGKYWVPIPHGDSEVLKCLYPESWWFEVKPPNCK